MSFEFTDELKKKMANLDEMSEMTLVYGIVDEDRTTNDVLVWKYAAWLEYGYTEFNVNYPPRPFFRSFQWNKGHLLKALCKKMFTSCANGDIKPLDAYKRVGRYAKSAILDSLLNGSWEPNSEKTVKLKGSDKPLVDTENMMKCIGFVIYKGNEEIYMEVVGSARKL